MTTILPESMEKLIVELSRLPTIGRKTAQRLAFHIAKHSPAMARDLARALEQVAQSLHWCRNCFFLAERELCSICSDPMRNPRVVCVVEDPYDVVAFEKAKAFSGLYHVLHGRISPLHGVMPEDLNIDALVARVQAAPTPIEEVIIATSPTVDGDATALFLGEKLRPFGCRMTRIGVGVSIGSSLELADELTLKHALERRREL